MKNKNHQLIYLKKATPSFELAGGQTEMISETSKQLDTLLNKAKTSGAEMTKASLNTVKRISQKTLNPEKKENTENNPFTHSDEILINQVADSEKTTLNKIVNIKITLNQAFTNLNSAISILTRLINKENAAALPSFGIKNFEEEIKTIFSSKDNESLKAKVQNLAVEMKDIYQKLQEAAIKIDISF